jgi:hypothetical protein
LIGIELAEMSCNILSYSLVREKNILGWSFALASQMINHIAEHHIDLKLETNLVEIISESHVKAVITDKGETIVNW